MIEKAHERLFDSALRSEAPTESLSRAVSALIGSGAESEDLLSELETFRVSLREQGREDDEDRVLEVMDFLVGWSSPHMRIAPANRNRLKSVSSAPNREANSIAPPAVLEVFPGTSGGIWTDREEAARYRDLFFPPTAFDEWTIAILNLTGILPTPGVLQDLLVPLAQRIRGGVYGPLVLVVQTADEGVGDFLRYLSREYSLPIFLAPAFKSLAFAEPLGPLTSTERTTMNVLFELGGTVTASELAQAINIEPTAAGNRLVGLASKGFIQRVPTRWSRGDAFVDFRTFSALVAPASATTA